MYGTKAIFSAELGGGVGDTQNGGGAATANGDSGLGSCGEVR